MPSKTKLDKNLLKGLEPLGNLPHDKLGELVSKATIEDLSAGRVLFREGEKDNRTLYLISGQVELQRSGEKKSRIIKARNAEACKPLDNHQPHTATARAKGPVTVVSIDSALLEIILNDTPLDAYEFEVTEISGDDTTDWMLRFLQSRAFLKLPTENIQAILMRMEELAAKKGEVILHQGDKDDYYYIVQSGSCSVSRRPAPKAGEIQLATLHEGDGFGEEALITNGRRNANVTMQEDGVLMRLQKADFLTYLAEPLITRFSESETAAKLDSGALLIDVRNHEEFNQQHVDGSVNIPLSMLRLKTGELNPEREYILASVDGTQSAAAAFLLTQHGFQCGILDGGLEAASFQLTGSNEPAAAGVTAAPASKRTAAAEKTRQAAEDRARKISQQANTARHEAEQLAQKTASAEQAKNQAEQEIQRLADQQGKQAEQAAREKAEQARQQAEAELREIQAAKQANEEKQQALDESLKRARQIAAEASQAAERSRQQAEKEAEAIRHKAREEASQLKQEMEATRRRFEQQSSQAEQEKEAQRQAAIEQARKEAESIRQQAQSEAERLRTELENARQAVNQRAAKVEQEERQKQVSLLEQARARAMELAEKTTRIAEQEAEEIRRKALDEAEQLRQEMEQTRQQVMDHASRAQQEAERQARREAEARAKEDTEQQARLEAEARAKEDAEQQARLEAEARAKEDAEQQARREAEARATEDAEQQARREAEARAKEDAEQQARREAEARAREDAAQKQEHEREARRQQAIRNAKAQREEHARRMAEEIKAKLEEAEQQRQNDEQQQRGKGFSIARATIKRKDGRIILEGEEDIFIFKEPSVTPEQVEAELAGKRRQQPSPAKNDLPSFDIEGTNKPAFKPANTRNVHARLAEQQANRQRQRKKRHALALVATLLLALGSGGAYVFLHPELLNEHLVARSESGKSTTTKASVGPMNNEKDRQNDEENDQTGQKQENNLQASIRERFDDLVQEWKEVVSP